MSGGLASFVTSSHPGVRARDGESRTVHICWEGSSDGS